MRIACRSGLRGALKRQMGPVLLPTPLSPARGLSSWRTIQRALGTRCFPFLPASRNSGSVTGARTGIRGLPLRIPSQRLFLRCVRSRDLPPLLACCLWRLRPDLGPDVSLDCMPGFPASYGLLSRSSRTAHLLPVETFGLWSSKTARTVTATSVGFENRFDFRSLDHQSKCFSRPSDELKLRLPTESFKLCKFDLSTFPRFRGGQGWITQRLVASRSGNDAKVRENLSLPLAIPLGEQLQAQRIEPDKAFRILLVIGPGIVLKGDMRL